MDFLESPRFPGCPSFGFTSDPRYNVTIVELDSGREVRNRNWSRPLLAYSVTVGPRAEEEIQECRDFYHVVGGTAYGFRFKDYADFEAVAQPLVEIPDSPGIYQLTKLYDVGGTITQSRDIYKPVPGSVTLSGAGTVDYTDGTVSGASPGTTWTGEFDVPVRFDSGFPIEILNRRILSVSFVLRELRIGLE